VFRVINIEITFDNRVERSSDQIIKPVNLAALTKWVGNIPEDVVREMADIAPMLSVLGYDPYANPPVYGAPVRVPTVPLSGLPNLLRVRSAFLIIMKRKANHLPPILIG